MKQTGDASAPSASVLLPLVYVASVLILDALVVQRVHWLIDWTRITWTLGGFNMLRSLLWLVIPLLWSARDFDWGYYGWRRWTRGDVVLFVVLMSGTLGVVFLLLPFLPGVNRYYQPHRFINDHARWSAWKHLALWNLGWLPGWEFMCRYFLLRRVAVRSPAAAVFLVAAVEGAYHLNKPALEAVAMVLFSVAASSWAVKRRNGLLPLLVHGGVECALSVYLVM